MLKKLFNRNQVMPISQSELECLGIAFQDAFKEGELQWQWDGRYNTVLAEFDSCHQEKVLSILGGCFTDYWYNHCINDAPNAVQRINDFLGG